MKAIFVSDAKETLLNVYAPTVRERLAAMVVLDPFVYAKNDLLATPDAFAEVEIVFSTWGMPVLTEEEIATLFPNLKCLFYAAGTVQTFARPFLKRGVRIFSAWAANAVPVAEYTVAEIILSFNRDVIDTVFPYVPAVKPQIAFYEKYGYHVLNRTLRLVIATWEGETNSLSAKTIDVTSSSTPSRDENSCLAPSTSIAYTLAPGIEDNKTLLNALPRVVPKPFSKGSIATLK